MPKTVLIPGLNGSDPGHWQRFWAEDQPDAVLLEQDRFEYPVLGAWLDRLERAILDAPGCYLVGHSLGSVLIAHLAGRPAAALVAGAVLVAPCEIGLTGVLHPGILRFGDMPDRPLPFPALVIGSLNDPYMPFADLEAHASRWQADVIDLGHAGHINIASGFGRWNSGYDMVAAFRTRVERRGWRTSREPFDPASIAANAPPASSSSPLR